MPNLSHLKEALSQCRSKEFNNATVDLINPISINIPVTSTHAAELHCIAYMYTWIHVGKGFVSSIQALLRLLHPDVIVPGYEVRHASYGVGSREIR